MARREPKRNCGTCSLCCKLFEVETVDSPAGKWCSKCNPPNGCSIHSERPEECKAFFCGWLAIPGLIDEWHPKRSKIILHLTDDGKQLNAIVDQNDPKIWREPIYYDQLKLWAK